MVLKFIDDSQPKFLKTMFYGIDGTGKSTGAKIYCETRGLKAVVIDFDYTNHTGLPRLQCDWKTPLEVINGMTEIINDIEKDPEINTLIIDGAGTFSELLLPKGKESRRIYLLRTQHFKKIWRVLLHAQIHIIFIGQKDLIVTEDNESSKFAEMINNMVDYKFHCVKTGKGFSSKDFTYTCVKSRNGPQELIGKPLQKIEPIIKEVPSSSPEENHEPIKEKPVNDFVTANEIPGKFVDDPVRNQCILIKDMLEKEGVEVNKKTMRTKVIRLINDGVLPNDNRPSLINYINENCPEDLD